jgi:putative ABC transport system ATP-binding protein
VDVQALRGVDFAIEPGAFVAFTGPSGSGKSTLLNMIGGLDKPSAGTLTVLDTDIASLDRRAAAEFRGANLGFIFQDFNLIPVLSAYENIEYPLLMVQDWQEAKRRVRAGIGSGRPGDQAGGARTSPARKQRVAVARARHQRCWYWPTNRPPTSPTPPIHYNARKMRRFSTTSSSTRPQDRGRQAGLR